MKIYAETLLKDKVYETESLKWKQITHVQKCINFRKFIYCWQYPQGGNYRKSVSS